jgi:hypothetical protein
MPAPPIKERAMETRNANGGGPVLPAAATRDRSRRNYSTAPGRQPSPREAALAYATARAVLTYAAAGWSIIPAAVDGKRALVQWKPFQTTIPDREQLRAWWRRWPRANLAVITGRLSGVVVVDVDPRHHGDQVLAELELAHGPLPTSAVVETPSGGWHVYLRHPGGHVTNSAGRIGSGVDVRGDGGLALLPPSRRGAGAYRWIAGGAGQVPPMPPAWIALLRPPPPRRPAPPVGLQPGGSSRDAARMAGVLAVLADAPEGQRNSRLYWCGKRLAELLEGGAPPSWVEVLERAALATGLTEREVRDTLTAALGGGDR